ncbi:mechanosensitive ion channel family protein [Agarivorans sp. TSD2052]|uniref:mechanosensitive ion channel family protein n=1 Tax=Agarivorans sp. TSD2052 TaxID=2937286 RepID=UPI00200C1C84|nr:mechanosensitive ion channel family protein [Agarivorans sp. TSD2052]UPW18352.1 mechanosensitive ion channel family protein [Agarivorans sp. TSD2052]
MDDLETWLNSKLAITICLIFFTFLVRYLALKLIGKKQRTNGKDHRDLISNFKNFLLFILVLLLFNLWAGEIQKFAFSLAAFAVAIVLATKEFIQCIIGFFYLMSTRPFRVGDWIEVDNHAGEVSQIDWIKTTVLEVNIDTYQYTGKTLSIPNNKLITSAIQNLNFMKRYAIHNFVLVRDSHINPFSFIAQLKENASQYCADFEDVALRYNQIIEHKMGISITGPKPQIEVGTTDLGHIKIEVTIFCPTDQTMDIEQKITADFFEFCLQHHAQTSQNNALNAPSLGEPP